MVLGHMLYYDADEGTHGDDSPLSFSAYREGAKPQEIVARIGTSKTDSASKVGTLE